MNEELLKDEECNKKLDRFKYIQYGNIGFAKGVRWYYSLNKENYVFEQIETVFYIFEKNVNIHFIKTYYFGFSAFA
eukprot:snap_masked-scaffold_21-processed-gene-2.7-mRNA-1 protein AED:1.00 eAED:1.00 QI:0/0/0/0/1/1/2/0/75